MKGTDRFTSLAYFIISPFPFGNIALSIVSIFNGSSLSVFCATDLSFIRFFMLERSPGIPIVSPLW